MGIANSRCIDSHRIAKVESAKTPESGIDKANVNIIIRDNIVDGSIRFEGNEEDKNGNLKVTEVNIRHMAYTGVMTRVGFDLIGDTMTIFEDGKADRIVRDQYHHYDKPYIFLRDVDVEPIVLESEEIFEQNNTL